MEIISKKKQYGRYDPLKLPKALDFHLLTKDLELPRETKTRIQIALSKMNKKQVKETIEYLGDMRYTAAKRDDYKMAAYCKAVKTFVEAYYKSLLEQRRI